MTTQIQKTLTALCVAVPSSWRMALAEMFELLEADSAVDARQALKTFAIDLLVISTDVPDEPFWSLVRRVRRARPSLAWILVGDVSDVDEVRARCLGVLTILGPDANGTLDTSSLPWRMTEPAIAGRMANGVG